MGKGIGGKIQAPCTLDKVSSMLELESDLLIPRLAFCTLPHIVQFTYFTYPEIQNKDMHTYLLNI